MKKILTMSVLVILCNLANAAINEGNWTLDAGWSEAEVPGVYVWNPSPNYGFQVEWDNGTTSILIYNGTWYIAAYDASVGWYYAPGTVDTVPSIDQWQPLQGQQVGSMSQSSGGGGSTYTNGVYILGGTNSVLVINNPTSPIPVYLVENPDSEARATQTTINGLWYGFAFATLIAGWLAIKGIWRAFLGGDKQND